MKLTWTALNREFLQLMQEGGAVLWFLLVLGLVLFVVIAMSWARLSQIRNHMEHRISSSCDEKVIEGDYAMFELDQIAPIQRRIPLIQVLVGAAPLTGLLGTVSGMLVTFAGMGNPQNTTPIDSIASGVSEALVTTQVGLLFAIPGAILLTLLTTRLDDVKSKLEQRRSNRCRGVTS